MRSAPPLAALALTVAVLLTGCVPKAPDIVPPPEPTSEPVFASDEEALAAATDAYAAYLAMSDLIAQEGGANPERIAPYVAEEILAGQLEQFEPYSMKGIRTDGATTFDTVTLQHFGDVVPGTAEVGIYVCLDVSSVKVLDEFGADLTPSGRNDRVPLEVGFESGDVEGVLVVNRSESWLGSSFC